MEFKGNPIIIFACYRLFGDLNFMVNPRQQHRIAQIRPVYGVPIVARIWTDMFLSGERFSFFFYF